MEIKQVDCGNDCHMNGDDPMINKTTPQPAKKPSGISHPGMMGDGTDEQNLNQSGNPAARNKKAEVDAAFNKPVPKRG